MSVSTIIEIFEDILDIKKGTVSLETTSSDIDQWDSVATVSIIVALEEEFGIRFKLKDIQTLKSVQDFVDLVQAYKNE
jgi:acyl carrier protein